MKTHYKTLKNRSEFLLKEKGSKFLAIAQSCKDENEIKQELLLLKELHPNATHICYAYKIGITNFQTRANDDGEPNNSAGLPILGQINSFELTNTLVAVIRYYGGTKLGVGGLISAYKNAAKFAIESNEIIDKEIFNELKISVDYENYPFLMYLFKQYELRIVNQNQLNKVDLQVEIPISIFEEVKTQILQINKLDILEERLIL